MNKISITTTTFGKYDNRPLTLLEGKGFNIVLNQYGRNLGKVEIIELCKNAVGIIAGTEIYDRETLEGLTGLKVISRCGTGLDNIDLRAANRLGIKVLNTPDATTLAVAELTVGLILNLLRKVHQMDINIRNGKWQKMMGNLLYGKSIGIIGFGRIGRKVAELLLHFGCTIQYYDLKRFDWETGAEGVQLKDLLKTSDIITIHVSSKDQIMGESEFLQMKKGAWLVNVSRGGVVDEDALYQAVKEGRLAGAALDVFEKEPYTDNLKELENVILTPHIGSYAKEARAEMERQAVENLLKGLKG
ncbi:MAG: hypothetical protein A2Z47_06940 [Thermodesulfovibrio sp. RBG_19FT_COMBO_42_12]|nr:MAG: hypothetical protein A2Z47_06940 [Thermodesulfovibrio sp. RBG_19FT_COMBO_42_12]